MHFRRGSLASRVHRFRPDIRALAAIVAILACGGSSDSTAPGGGGGGGGSGGNGVRIAITPSTPTLTVGSQLTLQAEVRGSNGQVMPGATVFWSSADTSIVTISSVGVITGKSIGNTQIAASSNGASTVATVTVVQVPVASVAVLPSAATLVIGGTVTLQAVEYDAANNPLSGRSVVWASSASQVATVDATGKVTAVAAGAATVSATVEGKTASSAITVTVIPVAAVAISPSSAALDVGASKAFNAIVTDANGNNLTSRPITWTSANTSIASVSSSGLVTGVGAGTTNITATAEGKTGTAQVVVTATQPPPPIPVASVGVNPANATLNIGDSVTLSAVVRDANTNQLFGRIVTWSTADPHIATVSGAGVVTAKAQGSVTITAISEGKSGGATITVRPNAPPSVASVTINPTGAAIDSGKTFTFTATVSDSSGHPLPGRQVKWSSNTAAATVAPSSVASDANGAASGVVTGVSLGNASIVATCEGAVASVVVVVRRVPVATVSVSAAASPIQVGATTTVTAVTRDSANNILANRTVKWSSSNAGVATVDSVTGVVTGVAPGTASITGTSEGQSGSTTITVNAIPVASITISPANPTVVERGTPLVLSALLKDAGGNTLTGRTVTWAVAPTSVATIDPSTGTVTGVTTGTATITATVAQTGGTASGTATLTVTPAPVATVSVSQLSGPMTVGQTLTLTDTTKDAGGFILTGRATTWSSSNPSKATVDPNSGLVTAVDSGSTTITATSEGKTGSANVIVQLVPVASVTVTVPSPIAANQSVLGTATPLDANGQPLSGRAVLWSSSDPTIASVDAGGNVTGLLPGTVTISATIDGTVGSTIITVTP